jgi:ketosteroid isomerase-like protein
MKTLTSIAFMTLIGVSGAAFSEEKMTMPMDHSKMKGMDHSKMAEPTQISIPVAAKDAVATVDRFSAALSATQLDKAAAELDANVLVLESGGAEHSAAEYLSGHAMGDAVFLQTVYVQLIRRTAQASGDMAWVGSESELHGMKDGKPSTILSTETMVLKRTDKTWKITHIHWSSRTKKADGSH